MVTIQKYINLKSRNGCWVASTQLYTKDELERIYTHLCREIEQESKFDNYAYELEEESKIISSHRLMPSRICKKKSPLSTKRKRQNSISSKKLSWTPVKVDLKQQSDSFNSDALSLIKYTPDEIKKKTNGIIWLKKQMNPDKNKLTTTIETVFDESSNNDDKLPNDHVDMSDRPESYNDPDKPEGFYGFGFECVNLEKVARSKRQHQITPRIKKHQVLSNTIKQVVPKIENDELALLYEAKRSYAGSANMQIHIRIHEFPLINPCHICKYAFTDTCEMLSHRCNFALPFFI